MGKARGALLVTAGTLAWAMTQWYLVWLFARVSGGPDAVGTYSSLIAVATPIFVIAQFGLRTVYLTLQRRWPWRSYLLLRYLGIAAANIILAVLVILDNRFPLLMGVSIMAVKSADSALDLFMGRIQRSNRLAVMGSLTLANSIVTAVLVSASMYVARSISVAILTSALVSAGVCFVASRLAGVGVPESSADGRGLLHIVRAGLPVSGAQLLAAISGYLPILMLTWWAQPRVVGMYAAAAYLLTAANLVGAVTQTTLISSFRVLAETSGEKSMVVRALRIGGLLLAGGALLVPIVTTLGSIVLEAIYGSNFALAQLPLLLLSVAAMAIAPSYVFSVVLCVLNMYRAELLIWASSLVVALLIGTAVHSVELEPLTVALCVAASISWSRLLGVLAIVIYASRDPSYAC